MRNNGALSGREIELRDDQLIVSRTDLRGRIVYANAEFIEISGYSEQEILGQPHNIIRHPEVPPEIFADLWSDIQAGRPWIGILKNRCKNGDTYWVEAHVSPFFENGVVSGYLSSRYKPSRAQIVKADALFSDLGAQRSGGVAFQHGAAIATSPWSRLRRAMADAPMIFKFVLALSLAALVVLGFFAYFLAQTVAQVLGEEARERLRYDVGLVRVVVETRLDAARSEAEDLAQTFSKRIYDAAGGKAAMSQAAIEALGRRVASNNEPSINAFLQDLRGVGTIFVRTPAGFERRVTSVKDERGVPAVGTRIEAGHPAFDLLLAGKPYHGSLRLFGRQMLANYMPIVDQQGEVVGASFIGFDLAEFLRFMKSELRGLKVGKTGYFYILDVTAGPNFGTLILHPFNEGQRVRLLDEATKRDIASEMQKLERGEIVYPWMNKAAGETEASNKVVIFETLNDPQWVIAGGASITEIVALSRRISWYVLAGGLVMAAAILLITYLLLRRLIFRPLNTQFLPAFQSMASGDFETRFDVRGNDELGRVMQGLECLQNRLAFSADQEKALAAARETALLAAENLSLARTEFLANMSHEIRTPMNAVIGLAYLLSRSNLGKKELDYVRRIESSGKLLLAVVNDILDFSKIDAGKLQIEEAPFRLDDVLENLSVIVRDRVQERQLTLEYVLASDVPQGLRGDALRLSQVLINLVGNAIKFTEQGSVTVFVNAEHLGDGQIKLGFKIQDTGIGMSPEQAAKLFRAFVQADTSTTRKFGGTGLGLSISKRLVEMMGGEIRVESQLASGSVFSFDIRVQVEDHFPDGFEHSSSRILVVDDNDLARTVLARLLQKQGCSAETADSGEAALVLMQEAALPFSCVLLDLNMPGMDGLTLAQHIRRQYGLQLKLVLVTAANIHAEGFEDALGDFNAVLEKPVTSARIAELLRQFEVTDSTLPTSPALVASEVSLAGLRILVADDVPTNQLIMRDLLGSLGAHVEIADNGAAVLRCLAEHSDSVDLILMDIQMPEMDGLEATRRIRSGVVRADIPIIALTAHALDEERQRTQAAGMNDFVTKPIDLAQLMAVLARWRPQRTEAVPPSPALTAAPAVLPDFPALPGIDVADGLGYMLNRRALYERVLRDFHGRFFGETERIRAALANNERKEAVRRAHTLKGLGATIGATELSRAAKSLEAQLSAEAVDLDPSFEAFDAALQQVLESIQRGLIEPA